MDLDLFVQSLGLTLETEGKNWVIVYDPNETDFGVPPSNLVHVRPDGGVDLYAEVQPGATLASVQAEGPPDRNHENLQDLHDLIFENIIDGICDNEEWARADLVKFMWSQCWERDPAGGVRHANDHTKHFDTWGDAIKACIEIASEL